MKTDSKTNDFTVPAEPVAGMSVAERVEQVVGIRQRLKDNAYASWLARKLESRLSELLCSLGDDVVAEFEGDSKNA